MRRVAAWAVLLLISTGFMAAGGPAAGSPSTSGTTRPITAAVVKTSMGGVSGDRRAVVRGGGPIIVRFVPQARFGIGIVLVNEAPQTVTLERVRVVVPDLLPLLQVGTRITRHGLASCPPHARGCLEPLVAPPFRAERTVPYPLAPGQKRVVQLNFRLGACSARNTATTQVRQLLVTYRTRAGLRVHQRLALGVSRIELIGVGKKTRCRVLP